MEFGSKFIYKYERSSSESVSDDDEEVSALSAAAIAAPVAAAIDVPVAAEESVALSRPTEKKRKKRLRKADTNILTIKFNRLLQPSEMHAGDPVRCSSCDAIASHLSKIQPGEGNDASSEMSLSKWQCEFCPNVNSVDIDQTDLPKNEDATYLVAPAPVVGGSDMSGVDDSIVIFVIDISGSMSSTTLVQGNFQLPNAQQEAERAAANFDGERMRRNRHQTYVSRLQGVQMAVDANLDKLLKDTPTRRVAIITFNHEITYYGDGTRDEPLVIRGDKLNSAEELVREAERELNRELKPISQTKTKLTERIYNLEEGGQTALGPAVLFALNIASQRRGSRIVVCTDGLANRGLGSLELAQDEKVDEAVKTQALDEGNQFYSGLTDTARDKGITMSVITIKGTSCLLAVIGQMADGSGGNVTIVDLMNIRDEFASILEQKVIATNVEATLIVHRGLYIRDPDRPTEKLEKVKREVGNATKQTEVTFEFGVRNKQELKEKFQIDLDQLRQLPFQVQVTYTANDGSKALRVLTQLKEATEKREIAEVNAYREVLADNHIRSTAAQVMLYDDDDDDDETDDNNMEAEERSSKFVSCTKWSSPVVQKQRMAYMSKISDQKRGRSDYDRDRFSESRWDQASNALKSHVHNARIARKPNTAMCSFESRVPPPPPPPRQFIEGEEESASPSIFGRISSYFGGGKNEKSKEKPAPAAYEGKVARKKGYGFSSSNVAFFTDRSSEDLYRYKNFSTETTGFENAPMDVERPPLPMPNIKETTEEDNKMKKKMTSKSKQSDSDSDIGE